ncbi:MAG: hypothetical protein COA96_14150 [SAR86 cluster bacterium]|uniref:Uncharacterized protein n=1 Tax=SAR86 cluster bacterium TaxID=2030880 RepID=A0A2A5ATA7_9GAMM|nr:MAG: hypothetical protein COA96_14150 [SAR86 cluster bacterium]
MAKSGHGKSQALKQNPDYPRHRDDRVLLWDPGRDHKAKRFTNALEYYQAIKKAMGSGKGFRLAWTGEQCPKEFERWSAMAFACMDGQRTLNLVIEELAAVQPSSGSAAPNFSILCNQSRKYAGVMHWTTQRSTEISKTVLDQTEIFYIGKPGKMVTKGQADRLARVAECPNGADDLQRLKPLQFYHATNDGSKLITLKYKKNI